MHVSWHLKDLSLSKKLLLAVGVFVLPLGLLGKIFFDEKVKLINFTKVELEGISYLGSMQAVVEALTAVKVMPENVLDAQKKLTDSEAQNNGLFHLTDQAKVIGDKLTKVAQGKNPGPALAKAQELISKLNDASKLVLDSDQDTYYLADLLTTQSILIMQRTDDVVNAASDMATNDKNLENQNQWYAALQQIQGMGASFSEELDKSIEGNSNGLVQSELGTDGKDVNHAIDGLVIAINAKHYADIPVKATDVLNKIKEFNIKGDKVLTTLFHERINASWNSLITQLLISFFSILLGALVSMYIVRSITRPIKTVIDLMARLSAGDLALTIPNDNRHDEVGKLIIALHSFHESAMAIESLKKEQEIEKKKAEEDKKKSMHALADKFEASVKSIVNIVSTASMEMQSIAQGLASNAEQTTEKSATVNNVSQSTSTSVQSVSAAVGQLTASITKISSQIGQAATVANKAAQDGHSVNTIVLALDSSAQKIGDVVQLIHQIAKQTNLLALNATIEAARAGEAGKGFAVVASEVKTLATQTGKATEEIEMQIEDIQSEIRKVVTVISDICTTLSEVKNTSSSIAAAIEEQTAATQEIARNVQSAASGTQTVCEEISGVNHAAQETGTSANQMLDAATELAHQSEKLSTEVDNFLLNVRQI